MNETWTRRLLLAAAAWNITGGVASLADPAHHLAQMYTAAPAAGDALFRYFYQCTWINVLAWGVAYGLAAFWPGGRVAVLAAGGAGKAAYFAACALLVAEGIARPLVLAFGLGDLLMAALFGWALVAQRRRAGQPPAASARRFNQRRIASDGPSARNEISGAAPGA